MESFIYLLPIVAVVALLASGRASLLFAGCVGTLLSVPAAWVALSVARGDAANIDSLSKLVVHAGLRGSWIAWQAVSIILGGLLLYNVLNVAGANATLISPIRIAMGCALVAIAGRESEVYRLVWPLGLVMLVVLEAFSFLA